MEQITTERLLLTPAKPSDLPALEEIEKECDEYFKFDPPCAAEFNRSLRECLATGDNIPGISTLDYRKESFYLYCIRENDAIIGWLSVYLDYLQKGGAYLSVLYIKEACRRRGVGAEIIEALTRKLLSTQYKTIRLHCSLRDATALRFWVKNGFDRILDVECDGNLHPGNFGGLELMKKLDIS
jgi:ribosomal protein S18 acetylase RimI-like enzyme